MIIYPNNFRMHVSVGVRNDLGKTLILEKGYLLVKINDAA